MCTEKRVISVEDDRLAISNGGSTFLVGDESRAGVSIEKSYQIRSGSLLPDRGLAPSLHLTRQDNARIHRPLLLWYWVTIHNVQMPSDNGIVHITE